MWTLTDNTVIGIERMNHTVLLNLSQQYGL